MKNRKEYRVSVRFTAELRRRLEAAAKREGKRESEVVREAVEGHLARQQGEPTTYELLKRAGLIGIVKKAPADLSTNPRYFEGFGKS
jgi:metal-responsive CopG/Arc/MetJ family transcriptional regulator